MPATISRQPGRSRSSAAISTARRLAGRFRRTRPSSSSTGRARGCDRHHAIQHRADGGAAARRFRNGRSTIPARAARTPFPGNTIPPSRFDPSRARCCSIIRCPTCPARRTITCGPRSEPDNQDQFDARLDRYFGEQHRVFGALLLSARRRYSGDSACRTAAARSRPA